MVFKLRSAELICGVIFKPEHLSSLHEAEKSAT